MVIRERILTREELLEYTIGRYNFYRKIADNEPSDHVSKFYLRDFMRDLLLIQNFARKDRENEDDKERPESVADVS